MLKPLLRRGLFYGAKKSFSPEMLYTPSPIAVFNGSGLERNEVKFS
jgi:hypothetical protein